MEPHLAFVMDLLTPVLSFGVKLLAIIGCISSIFLFCYLTTFLSKPKTSDKDSFGPSDWVMTSFGLVILLAIFLLCKLGVQSEHDGVDFYPALWWSFSWLAMLVVGSWVIVIGVIGVTELGMLLIDACLRKKSTSEWMDSGDLEAGRPPRAAKNEERSA